MGTITIRDIETCVIDALQRRAAAQGLSLSALVARELTAVAERPSNVEIVDRLRRVDRAGAPTTEEILAALHESRR